MFSLQPPERLLGHLKRSIYQPIDEYSALVDLAQVLQERLSRSVVDTPVKPMIKPLLWSNSNEEIFVNFEIGNFVSNGW